MTNQLYSRTSLITLGAALALVSCSSDGGADSASLDGSDGIGSGPGQETSGTDGGRDAGDQGGQSQGDADQTSADDGFNCGEVEVQLDAQPGRVMLVLDKSGSMVFFTWDHDDDPATDEVTRWFSLHAVVDNITSTFNDNIDFGMILYPSLQASNVYNHTACIVQDQPEVGIAPSNAAQIMNILPPANAIDAIRGGTPSLRGVEVALEHLRSFEVNVPRAILYVTDGEANCSEDAQTEFERFEVYDDAVHAVVEEAWQAEGIPTYVVGIAIRNFVLPDTVNGAPNGINPHERLNDLAVSGGRPRDGEVRYYQTDNQIELQLALEAIAAEQVSCIVELNPPPDHPQYVSVELNGETVPQVSDCATEDGWIFHEPDEQGVYTHIELCGSACDTLVTIGAVDATYGCPPPM